MQPDQASADPPRCETIEELFAALESALLAYALRLAGELGAAATTVRGTFSVTAVLNGNNCTPV